MLRRTANGVIILVATFGVATGCGGDAGNGEILDPEMAVLHAGDLPRGYREGDDTVCGVPSATEGNWPRLERLFWETQPKACVIELGRIWARTPGVPGGVTSAAFVFADTRAAQRGYRAQVELLRFTASVDAQTTEAVALADEAQLVEGYGLNDDATAVVWRDGSVVALLAVEPASETAALELARRQQELIEGDATPAARVDGLELPLDDPAMRIPVYWLGRTFEPAGALPRLELVEVYASSIGAQLGYSSVDRDHPTGLRLEVSRPEDWQRWRRTRLGRLVWDSPCARKTVVQLPNGRAEIFEGYGVSRPVKEPCPTSKPDRVVAHIYLNGVAITVNMPFCYTCGVRSTGNPFETVDAMASVARSLKLRRRS